MLKLANRIFTIRPRNIYNNSIYQTNNNNKVYIYSFNNYNYNNSNSNNNNNNNRSNHQIKHCNRSNNRRINSSKKPKCKTKKQLPQQTPP
jgi:hypothetical protein